MRIYDRNGLERDEAWLRANFGAVEIVGKSDRWFVEEFREVPGNTAMTVTVRDRNGLPVENAVVQFGWPDGLVEGPTNSAGAIGFGMGGDSYYKPDEVAGPHFVIFRNVRVNGLGMVFGTDHDHIEPFYREIGDAPEPPEPPPGTDENWTELFRLLNHIIALLENCCE